MRASSFVGTTAVPRTTLLRGATVLTMDPTFGDLERGDLLIDEGQIRAVAPRIELDTSEPNIEVVDATDRIVIPGFVDTHRHMWEALVRGAAPHHTLEQYYVDVLGGVGERVPPDDVYVGTPGSARSALLSGITTVQDIANAAQLTPEHTDATVAAARRSGLRTIFAYGSPYSLIASRGTALADDVRRVRSRLLADDDADVKMALLTEWGGDDTERSVRR